MVFYLIECQTNRLYFFEFEKSQIFVKSVKETDLAGNITSRQTNR